MSGRPVGAVARQEVQQMLDLRAEYDQLAVAYTKALGALSIIDRKMQQLLARMAALNDDPEFRRQWDKRQERLRRGAEIKLLRSEGKSWDEIGEELGISADYAARLGALYDRKASNWLFPQPRSRNKATAEAEREAVLGGRQNVSRAGGEGPQTTRPYSVSPEVAAMDAGVGEASALQR